MSNRKDSNTVTWYWANRNSSERISQEDWIPFNPEINERIEQHFILNSPDVQFNQAGERYNINLETMQQNHINDKKSKWPVKREIDQGVKISSKQKRQIDLRKSSVISNDSVQLIENLDSRKVHLNKDDAKSLYLFGMCYLKGDKGKSRNLAKAMKLLHKSAQLGNPDAQYTLGLRYLSGIGVQRDLKQAYEFFLSSAQQGNPSAQYSVSICYKNGDGVSVDLASGLKFLQLAAESGHKRACFHFGMSLMLGIGVTPDFKQGFDYLKASADKGYSEAMYQVYVCYSEGKGVGKDLKKAKSYFKLANVEEDIDRRSLNLVMNKNKSNQV